MARIPEGYDLLLGLGREKAIAALAEAAERGLDATVVQRSYTLGGYLIPSVEHAEGAPEEPEEHEEPEEPSDTQDAGDQGGASDAGDADKVEGVVLDDLTIPELKDLAAANEIDLDGATRKADIVAAIESSGKITPAPAATNKKEN